MRIPRLFIEQSLSSGDIVSLPKDRAHYLSNVLRVHTGDVIKLFNNTGYEFNAVISGLTKKNAEVEIRESCKQDRESTLKITLCLAVARGQHMDYSIQKSVELGVHTIIPVISEFSNVKLRDDRIDNKMMHWKNIVISAAEQSGRNKLPELITPISFSECCKTVKTKKRLILNPESEQAMPAIQLEDKEVALMIGPEGGFSDAEVTEAIEQETIPVSLGPRILRAETAVVSALSNAQQLWGDLN